MGIFRGNKVSGKVVLGHLSTQLRKFSGSVHDCCCCCSCEGSNAKGRGQQCWSSSVKIEEIIFEKEINHFFHMNFAEM